MADAPRAGGSTELIRITINPDWVIELMINPWVIALALAVIGAIVGYRLLTHSTVLGKNFELDEAEFGLGNSKVIFRPNEEDRRVAYQIWVELSTRKIGLQIDLDNDVVSEIYDSWHTFFTVTRELIKEIPISRVRSNSTKKIIGLSIDVLNEGLRPHLTRWQARFRRWYDYQLAQDVQAELHPQDIQRKFPEFEALREELLEVNRRLIHYRTRMNDLVQGL